METGEDADEDDESKLDVEDVYGDHEEVLHATLAERHVVEAPTA